MAESVIKRCIDRFRTGDSSNLAPLRKEDFWWIARTTPKEVEIEEVENAVDHFEESPREPILVSPMVQTDSELRNSLDDVIEIMNSPYGREGDSLPSLLSPTTDLEYHHDSDDDSAVHSYESAGIDIKPYEEDAPVPRSIIEPTIRSTGSRFRPLSKKESPKSDFDELDDYANRLLAKCDSLLKGSNALMSSNANKTLLGNNHQKSSEKGHNVNLMEEVNDSISPINSVDPIDCRNLKIDVDEEKKPLNGNGNADSQASDLLSSRSSFQSPFVRDSMEFFISPESSVDLDTFRRLEGFEGSSSISPTFAWNVPLQASHSGKQAMVVVSQDAHTADKVDNDSLSKNKVVGDIDAHETIVNEAPSTDNYPPVEWNTGSPAAVDPPNSSAISFNHVEVSSCETPTRISESLASQTRIESCCSATMSTTMRLTDPLLMDRSEDHPSVDIYEKASSLAVGDVNTLSNNVDDQHTVCVTKEEEPCVVARCPLTWEEVRPYMKDEVIRSLWYRYSQLQHSS